ncbi:hypothetical protein [uncultured Devosia sp.]|uniref:hypothetical protein n=1 Tax=uncultured Devosia sp. TaxID=211434 RepID=UPI0035CC77E1
MRPDPAPIREALRGVRHVLRRVKASLRDMPAPPLPGPAGEMAGRAVREVSVFATGLDAAASNLARKVLGGTQTSAIQLPEDVDSAAFAGALYWALQHFFQRFEVPDQFVSELAARAAYEKTLALAGETNGLAADLTLQLLADGVIRGPVPGDTGIMASDDLRPVAVFSAML